MIQVIDYLNVGVEFFASQEWEIDWLSKVLCPTKHIIGHIGDGFLCVKWSNQRRQSTEGTKEWEKSFLGYNRQTEARLCLWLTEM